MWVDDGGEPARACVSKFPKCFVTLPNNFKASPKAFAVSFNQNICQDASFLPPASKGWGKVLFSVCQSTPGGGVPHPMGYPPDLGRGTPLDLGQGTPQTWDGVPPPGPGMGYPARNSKHLLRLRGGRYARRRTFLLLFLFSQNGPPKRNSD